MSRFRVIVADDHPLFREGVVRAVRAWPELELVGEVSNGREALEQIRELSPDVACVDLRLPEIDGIGIANACTRDGLATRVLLLSAFADDELVYRALEAGATGYLTKDATQDEIARAIHGVAGGHTQLAPELAAGPCESDPRSLARRHAAPHRARAAGARAALRGTLRATDRAAAVSRHDDRQVPSRPAVREARRLRSRGRRRRGDAPRHRGVNEQRLPDAERLTALLRLVAVPVLLVGEAYVPKPAPSEGRFYVVLAVFTLYALGTLAAARLDLSARRHWQWLAVADIAFAGALTYSSGGGFSQLRFAFLFPVVVVAFRGRPLGTAIVAAASTIAYLVQAAPHPSRSSSGALSFVLVQAAYLAWLGLALALLSLLLARRDAAVRLLSAQRQRLVAEALTAEERERRQLAQDLHDGAIQNLLAARHDLDLAAARRPRGGRGARARRHHRHGGRAARCRRRPASLPARAGRARRRDRAGCARRGRARGIRAPARRDRGRARARTTAQCCAARASCSRTWCGTRPRRRSRSSCSAVRTPIACGCATTAWGSTRSRRPRPCAPATSAWRRCASAPRPWAGRSRSRAHREREPSRRSRSRAELP